MMFFQRIAAGLLVMALPAQAIAASHPVPTDFDGTWRIGKWIGESEGGFSGPDPATFLNKSVQITTTMVQAPDRTCHLQHPSLKTTPNKDIEFVWGRQRIDELRLSNIELATAFGPEQTYFFIDESACISAVMIDHDHIIDALGSGVIYRLDRVR